MALDQGIAWEARADGNAANGGGFKIGATGVDRCQQASQHATLTTASVVHSTTTQLNVSAGDYTVSADDVGNVVFVTGGSATPGRYEITVADVGNNRWTVDRSLGTVGQTCPGRMGGAVSDPRLITETSLGHIWVAGNTMWVRGDAGTFVHTTDWGTGNATGQWSTAARGNRIIGYMTTRGDTPTGTDRPLFELSTNSNLIALKVEGEIFVQNLRFDCKGLTGSGGIHVGSVGRFFNCYITDAQQYGIYGIPALGLYVDCEIDTLGSSATLGGISTGGGWAVGCWAHDNPCAGFIVGLSGSLDRCLSTKNLGATTDGVFAFYQTRIQHCTIHGNGRDGIRYDGNFDYQRLIRGNLLTDNGQSAAGYGINFPSGTMPESPHADFNAFWSNATGETNGLSDTGGSQTSGDYTTNNVSVGGDPYVDASTDNYNLNDTDGVDCWGTSPFTFIDIGALQHDPDLDPVPPSGGGGPLVGGRLVR